MITLKWWVYIIWCYNCDDWVTHIGPDSPDWWCCPVDEKHFVNEGTMQLYEDEKMLDLQPINFKPVLKRLRDQRNQLIVDTLYGNNHSLKRLVKKYGKTC